MYKTSMNFTCNTLQGYGNMNLKQKTRRYFEWNKLHYKFRGCLVGMRFMGKVFRLYYSMVLLAVQLPGLNSFPTGRNNFKSLLLICRDTEKQKHSRQERWKLVVQI